MKKFEIQRYCRSNMIKTRRRRRRRRRRPNLRRWVSQIHDHQVSFVVHWCLLDDQEFVKLRVVKGTFILFFLSNNDNKDHTKW